MIMIINIYSKVEKEGAGMVRRLLLAVCVVIASAGAAFAAHPLITDDTGTQGKGKFQLEVNGAAWNERV